MSKDNWDKFEIIIKAITALATVCVPILIAIYGNEINTSIKNRELQQQKEQYKSQLSQKYIEIAVSILNSNPLPKTKPLRVWAIDTLNKYSAIKLTDVQKKVLIDKQPFSAGVSLSGVGGKGGVGNLSVSGDSKMGNKPEVSGSTNVELNGVGSQGASYK